MQPSEKPYWQIVLDDMSSRMSIADLERCVNTLCREDWTGRICNGIPLGDWAECVNAEFERRRRIGK